MNQEPVCACTMCKSRDFINQLNVGPMQDLLPVTEGTEGTVTEGTVTEGTVTEDLTLLTQDDLDFDLDLDEI